MGVMTMSKYYVKLNSKFITTKWWSQKWCNNISQYADFYNRLERGRSYLRRGAVQDLVIEGGTVTASVIGSAAAPYQVVVKIDPLPDERAKEILNCLHNIEEFQRGHVSLDEKFLFSMDNNGLFPTLDEIKFSCTCPDWASLCKHIAAVLYAIGSILDQEPLVLFQLRGIDVDAYLETSLLEKTNTLLTNIYNTDSRAIDEDMISEIFGIELEPLPMSPTSNECIAEASKTSDTVRIIEIKPPKDTPMIVTPKKVIRQYTLDGIFVEQFESYADAAHKTNIERKQISEACNGRIEIAGDYQWRFADATDATINISKYIPLIDFDLLISCPIQQLDSSGKLIAQYSSAAEASRKTEISINWIRDALSGRQSQAGGFVWAFLSPSTGEPSHVVALEEHQSQEAVGIRQDYSEQDKHNVPENHEEVSVDNSAEIIRQKREELKQKEILRQQEQEKQLREKIAKQKDEYRRQGLCQHCGGKFKKKFLFITSDICSRCGKKKDY